MDIDNSSSLKRCLSAPMINNIVQQTPNKQMPLTSDQTTSNSVMIKELPPMNLPNIFTRARRHSASFSPLSVNNCTGPRLTPRVSQLRQEECADITNSREVNHEREVHSTMLMSQSWEDLTLVTENLSFKNDDCCINPLNVNLPVGPPVCSSPSPTRNGLRLPYGLSPSPTRKTFQTRRSMSPIAMRPSSLGPVKRKFELDEPYQNSYSPPPFKKIFTERGPSPICQTPSPICPSPDSFEGRITPKLFSSKLTLNNTNTNSSSSVCSSPLTPSMMMEVSMDVNNTITEGDSTLTNSDIEKSSSQKLNDNNNKNYEDSIDSNENKTGENSTDEEKGKRKEEELDNEIRSFNISENKLKNQNSLNKNFVFKESLDK